MKKPSEREKDEFRIVHIIKAIDEVAEFIEDSTLEEFKSDRILVLATVKEIEIIGEAASQISENTANKFPEIPWRQMVSIRNRLIHGYFDVDEAIVYKTLVEILPGLGKELKKVVKKLKRK